MPQKIIGSCSECGWLPHGSHPPLTKINQYRRLCDSCIQREKDKDGNCPRELTERQQEVLVSLFGEDHCIPEDYEDEDE